MPHHKELPVTDATIDAWKAIPFPKSFACLDSIIILLIANGWDHSKYINAEFVNELYKTDVRTFGDFMTSRSVFHLVPEGEELDGDIFITNRGECIICAGNDLHYVSGMTGYVLLDYEKYASKGERYYMNMEKFK